MFRVATRQTSYQRTHEDNIKVPISRRACADLRRVAMMTYVCEQSECACTDASARCACDMYIADCEQSEHAFADVLLCVY